MRRAYIVIILILISFGLKAQVYQAMPQAGYGPVKRFLTDSVLTIPTGINSLRNITGGRDAGQIRWNTTDSGFYVYSGTQWIKINIDSVSLSNRINSKLSISDTAAMLAPYMKKVDTISLSNRIDLRVKYTDTALMLDPYLIKLDTASLSNRINKKMDSLILTTTGNSGASTLIGTILNIPNYSGALTGYVPYVGATTNVNLGLKSLNGAVVSVDSSFQIKNGGQSFGNSSMDYTAITADRDLFNFFTVWMQGAQQYQNGAQFLYPQVSGMVNNTKQYRLPVRNGTIALVEDTVNLSNRIDTKLAYTDTVSLSNRINLKADKSTTLSINGTTYDLSANRSWNIPVIDTTSLSNRINTKLNISDTASMLSNYQSAINARVKYTDTAAMLSPYQTAINARVKYSDTAAMLDPYLTAAVTSVGLSMPVAFSVANTPVTSTGTLVVTAIGNAAQYIRGDGQLATLPTGGGGGSSVNYYLNGGTSQGTIGGSTYYEMSKEAVIDVSANFDRTNAQGNGLIAQFITDANDPNRIEIPAGAWNFELFFSASSSGGTPSYYVELLKYDGTTFTSIASGVTNPESITGGTTKDLYLSSLAVPYTMLSITDRLVIRVYVVTSGKTITLYTQNGNLCQIITTFAGGVSSLNGLTANTQYLAVGTAGTDFAINSLTDTHTFNLPTASATNRGALSSADWSTFNGKMNYSDTASLSNRINLKLNSADTISLSNRINTKLNSADTASLSNRIDTKQPQLNGTGFVKAIGTTISYDNSSYLTTGTAASTYVPYLGATGNVNLGVYKITSSSSTLTNSGVSGGALNIQSNPSTLIEGNGYVSVSSQDTMNLNINYNGITKMAGLSGSLLTTNRQFYFPNTNGTFALTSQLTGGTVTSVATGLGLSGGTITTSGTLLVDTSSASILSRQRAANTYQPIITNNITGIGTTNYLPKFTGSTTLGNSNLISDASGNVGLGVTPSAWNAGSVLQIQSGGTFLYGGNSNGIFGVNAYYNSGWKYVNNGYATSYEQTGGNHQWNVSPSGTAGNPITFTQAMTLTAAGRLLIGAADDGSTALNVSGSGKFSGKLDISNIGDSYVNILSANPNTSSVLTMYNSSGTTDGAAIGYNAALRFGTVTGSNATGFSQKMVINSAGNVGIGVTPSAWSAFNALELANGVHLASYTSGVNILDFGINYHFNGSAYIYKNTDAASQYQMRNGEHRFFVSPSGTAGNPITFTQAMTLTAAGNVGIGTTSPQTKLDVVGSGATINILDNGALAAGVGGQLNFQGTYNNIPTFTNAGWIKSSKSNATNGDYSFDMIFATRLNGSVAAERMRITSGGDIKMGTATTKNILMSLSGTSNPNVGIYGGAGSNTVNSAAGLNIVDFTNNKYWQMQIDGSSQLRTFYYNGTSWATNGYQTTGGTWTNSDERRKTNIEDLEYGLKEVLQLTPKKFNFKHDIEGGNIKQKDMGFIAQEVLKVMPLAVDTYIDGEQEFYSMNYSNIIPTLVKAIQEQQQQIETLKSKIQTLENK